LARWSCGSEAARQVPAYRVQCTRSASPSGVTTSPNRPKARMGITADGARIVRAWVGLHQGHRRVGQQLLDEGPYHRAADALVHLVGMREELVDAAHAGVGDVLPPAIARAHGDIGLDEADGGSVERSDIGQSGARGALLRYQVRVQLVDAIGRLPPLRDMGLQQPAMQQGQVLRAQQVKAKAGHCTPRAQAGRRAISAHRPAAPSREPPARLKRRCARGEASSRLAEPANTA